MSRVSTGFETRRPDPVPGSAQLTFITRYSRSLLSFLKLVASLAPMHAIRACRAFLTAGSLTCQRSCSHPLRHLERRIPSRFPSRNSVFSPSYRNLSISTPRRAQYSRFDNYPSRPPPSSAGSGFQTRDIVIQTVAGGFIAYVVFQCVTVLCYLYRVF
jgi:hypothetical protein